MTLILIITVLLKRSDDAAPGEHDEVVVAAGKGAVDREVEATRREASGAECRADVGAERPEHRRADPERVAACDRVRPDVNSIDTGSRGEAASRAQPATRKFCEMLWF